ncbi:helix-turn-helix domain-containing protein [Pseudonocardia endophytica]|uniref:XRE family transcriptional regulator n=1 Tax=Pseudonocardia endophytica TaxID=401976 RepID=A0A4R1HM19_PSEEN|nr:XRE family transcriptional regulator [Pseudonocardia endophytica]TCK21575.1 XRE family transcriptional regulator [Pseudonocardia endophytica]
MELTDALAQVVAARRAELGLSPTDLARSSGVSRAMIGKIERGEAAPTAALLGRLSGALGMTLSQLVARAEQPAGRVRRAVDAPVWTDPATGYRRRAVSPTTGGPLELVEVDLPPGAEVAFPADTYAFVHHQIWVLDGHLRFREGEQTHELDAGDCLELGPPQPCAYVNPGTTACRYLVALTRSR